MPATSEAAGLRAGNAGAEKEQMFQELLDGPEIEAILSRDAGYKKSPRLLQQEAEAWRYHYGKFL